jgi:hypothetical protein
MINNALVKILSMNLCIKHFTNIKSYYFATLILSLFLSMFNKQVSVLEILFNIIFFYFLESMTLLLKNKVIDVSFVIIQLIMCYVVKFEVFHPL